MFSENLKTIRKAKGYTQEELAIKVNVVRQTVSKWEKGLSVPDADVLSPIDKERIASSDKVRASTYLKYKDCLACFISALSVSAPRTMRLRTFAPH